MTGRVLGFPAAAAGVLDDLRTRVGLGSWAVGRRDGADYVLLASTSERVTAGTTVPWADTLVAQVAEGSAPPATTDARGVPGYARALTRVGCPVRGYLCVPVLDPEGRTLGFLSGWDPQPSPALAGILPLATRYARLLGTLLSHEERLQEETRRAERAEAIARKAQSGEATLRGDRPEVDRVDELLAVARARLGMDVALLSRFDGPDWVVRNAVSGGSAAAGPFRPGLRVPLEQTYCDRMVAGTLDRVVVDARHHPVAGKLAVTADLDVDSWMGVPVYRRGGSLYGTLCALSHAAGDPAAASARRQHDLSLLEVLAVVVAELVEREDEAGPRQDVLARLDAVREAGGPRMVFQPVVSLADGHTVGYEALSRFPAGGPPPQRWFADAAAAGYGPELELLAVSNALQRLDDVPGRLGLNVSPDVLCSPGFGRLLGGVPLDRLTLELTEHQVVEDYDRVLGALRPLRAEGLELAVDDVGAGFSSLLHVLRMEPDVLKLDVEIVRQVDTDSRRRTLAESLGRFAADHGARVVAEGIETEGELACLRETSISLGQGYLLGRPADLAPGGWVGEVSTRRGA